MNSMLKHIRMPVVVKALCGATIGFLVGLYVVNNYFGGTINYVVYLAPRWGQEWECGCCVDRVTGAMV